MPFFPCHDQELYAEQLPLKKIAAEFGTPCYVYSKQAITHNWQQYIQALQAIKRPYKVFYAIKANSNIAILNLLANLGAGFDAVSGGEIERALAAGAKPNSIVFSGVGKSSAEIARAIDLNIHSINIESIAELHRVAEIAHTKNTVANIALRINPDISIDSHPYISTGAKQNKFGIDFTQAIKVFDIAASLVNVKLKGISCHIGSQITTVEPFVAALRQLLSIVSELRSKDIQLEFIDIGGGLGVQYKDETPPSPAEYINAIAPLLKDSNLELHLEPGRSVVANAGVLLTKIEYLKTNDTNSFAIVDAGMNDLIRPALYQSYHDIVPVDQRSTESTPQTYSIVGPVCESGDFFATGRVLNLQAGNLIAIKSCGAYGFSMSSNYNTRPRCAEVLVDKDTAYLIRKRETIEQLLQNESLINAPRFVPSKL